MKIVIDFIHGGTLEKSRTMTQVSRKHPKGFQHFDYDYYSTDGYDDYLDRFTEEAHQVVIEPLLRTIDAKKSWKFLDVGCGMGGSVVCLRGQGFDAWGTEVSEYCMEHSPVAKWMLFGTATEIPFPDNHFDVVICKDVFPYLTKDSVLDGVNELVRVSKRYIAFSTIDKDSPNSSQDNNPDEYRDNHVQLFGRNEYKTIFANIGASLIKEDIFAQPYDMSLLLEIL